MDNLNEVETYGDLNEFAFTAWVKRGNMNIQRIALDCEDPESVWMLWWQRFEEPIPMNVCDQIWGEGATTEAAHAEASRRIKRHVEQLLLEEGAFITD